MEISRKFVEQFHYNEAINERMKQTIKKMQKMKNDLDAVAK